MKSMNEKTSEQQLGIEPAQSANPWGSSLDKFKEWDPKGAELLLRVGTNPCTNFEEAGTRRHIRAALDAGATRDEILCLLKSGAAMAVHSCSLGAPILLEEMKAAGVNAGGSAKPETPVCDGMRKAGAWNPVWDPLYDLSPVWTEDLFAFAVGSIYKRGVFPPRFIDLMSIAFDASITPHVCARHSPAHQRRSKGGRDPGRDHGSPAYLRFDGSTGLCQGRAHSR